MKHKPITPTPTFGEELYIHLPSGAEISLKSNHLTLYDLELMMIRLNKKLFSKSKRDAVGVG